MAVTAGIGLFITLIGLSSAGLIVSSPATLVSLDDLHTPNSLIAILGIILIAIFTVRNVKGGIFLAVIISAIVGFFQVSQNYQKHYYIPLISVILRNPN